MKHLFAFVILITSVAAAFAAAPDSLMRRLDEAIEARDATLRIKQHRIDSLHRILGRAAGAADRFDILGKLYDEYLTYSFDSTMACIDRAEAEARRMDNPDALALVAIRKALSLATSGHFSQAAEILRNIDSHSLPPHILREYYSACEWTYGVWAEYSDDNVYSPQYKARSIAYLDSLIAIMAPGSAEYDYRSAEKCLRAGDFSRAETLYRQALANTPMNTRLYAQAAYALAIVYQETGNETLYRQWLIRAAISDQITPLKENLALQQLAHLLTDNDNDLPRANRYLRTSLDDAIFYNNRLRMLEVAAKFPDITIKYQDRIAAQNRSLRLSIAIIAILGIAMAAAIWQLGRLSHKRRIAIDARQQLADQLAESNRRLIATNRMREQYTSLFVDLCGAYIDKLNRFPAVLKMKVRQLSDLNAVADRYVRPSEADIREMFFNYDSAFLRLYPDFIEEFNKLLRPDKRIYPKEKELLNTDLRIYSLVRMGITDSNRIASLLFFSPQTIFNHRTAVRNRAIDRNTFEQQVAKICTVAP